MQVPQTQGVKYAGSKLKLLPYIMSAVKSLPVRKVLDAFAGTTRVSQAFAQSGYDTTCNDVAVWSEVFGNCYLVADKPDAFYQKLIDQLNRLDGYDGWFSQHYGGEGPEGHRPFQLHNTRKLDAIRDQIDRFDLSWPDKCVLLTSLILGLDAVDNTLGHYAAYLSGWSARSCGTLELKLPRRFRLTTHNRVLRSDVFEALRDRYDLVYFDPPYGSNNEKMPPSRVRYAAYYHLWKTVILNDRPELFGKSARREDSRDAVSASVFEEYRKDADGKFLAMRAIDRMLAQADARYVLLSYSSGGRATREELFETLQNHGRLLSAVEIDYRQNVMAHIVSTRQWLRDEAAPHKEYLFLLDRR
ncbi:MAG: DNA adenine methylase [Paludibacteraceae bacterium]|nr:DNA adenine methylase [Paludibacteraceae bacterium]